MIRRHQKREEKWKEIFNNKQSKPEDILEAQEKFSKRQNRINAYDKEKRIIEPFIRMKSLSGGNDFCLWIRKTSVNEANYQKFSTYGLSGYDKENFDKKNYSTVPEF